MLVPGIDTHTPEHGEVPEAQRLLPTELDFYQAYGWCLNPYPTVREAIGYLRGEIGRLEIVQMAGRGAKSRQTCFFFPAHC